MKTIMACLAGTLLLVGCKGAPPNEKILSEGCQQLFSGDAEIISSIVEDTNADLETFCGCYAQTIVQDPVKTDLHKDALVAINTARAANNIGVEAAVQVVEAQIVSGANDLFSAEELDGTGDDFQAVGESMAGTGQCPDP